MSRFRNNDHPMEMTIRARVDSSTYEEVLDYIHSRKMSISTFVRYCIEEELKRESDQMGIRYDYIK